MANSRSRDYEVMTNDLPVTNSAFFWQKTARHLSWSWPFLGLPTTGIGTAEIH
jgi:hypothetical protein